MNPHARWPPSARPLRWWMMNVGIDYPPRVARTRPGPSPLSETAPGPADNAALPPPQAAFLPAQLLQPGEIIVLLLKPSPWYILLEPLHSVVAIVVLALTALWLAAAGVLPMSQRDLSVIAVGLVGVRLFWQFLEWLSRIYVLTDQRVVTVRGVLRVQVFETQLKSIQHTNLLFSVRERLVGLGTILFATAGTAFPESAWRMIARPLDVHQKVVQTIQRYR
jgi:hypothetical protein